MSRAQWTIDDLRNALNADARIKDWVAHIHHFERHERYFLKDGQKLAIDQDREVEGRTIDVRLFAKKEEGTQGDCQKQLFLEEPLAPQIESAVKTALLAEQKEWSLPIPLAQNTDPSLKTIDPDIAENPKKVVSRLSRSIEAAALDESIARFNSAELFVSLHEKETLTSRGLRHRSKQSRIYAEAAFSSEEDEYMSTRWAVHSDDIAIEQLFREAAERAAHTGKLRTPEAGNYSVILDSEVLLPLMHDCAEQVSAYRSYLSLPHRPLGAPFIEGAKGDLLTLTLNPWCDYGADTTLLSSIGDRQDPVTLVDRNEVKALSIDSQYAQYLGQKPGTTRGDIEVPAGSKTYSELLALDDRVLEILQFSGLFTDSNSGTFSSEIRLARLHDRKTGAIHYLKGGSLSGNVFEHFKEAWFSQERSKRISFTEGGKGYFGPSYVLLRGVPVAS